MKVWRVCAKSSAALVPVVLMIVVMCGPAGADTLPSNPSEIKTLTVGQAQSLVASHSNNPFMKPLDSLTQISPEVAGELAKYKGLLALNGLQSLSPEVADELAKHDGVLVLNGISEVSLEAARAIAKHRKTVQFNKTLRISDEALAELKNNPKIKIADVERLVARKQKQQDPKDYPETTRVEQILLGNPQIEAAANRSVLADRIRAGGVPDAEEEGRILNSRVMKAMAKADVKKMFKRPPDKVTSTGAWVYAFRTYDPDSEKSNNVIRIFWTSEGRVSFVQFELVHPNELYEIQPDTNKWQ